MAGRTRTRWRGRYTDKRLFMRRMTGIVERQVEVFEADPEAYRAHMPRRIHMHETEITGSALISTAALYAECLIAIGRVPTPEYLWHLMYIDPADAPPYYTEDGIKTDWQAHLSPGLLTLEEYRARHPKAAAASRG